MTYKLYKLVNLVNNKLYVGKTVQSLEKRFCDHIYEAKRWQKCLTTNNSFGYNSKLYPAMNKYGYENFEILLIEEVNSLEKLNEREKFWINQLHTREYGYNIAAGGDGGFFLGCKHSKETIEKLRLIALKRIRTEETCLKISKSKLGHVTTEETKEKIKKAKSGVKLGKHSADWNQNISNGHINEIVCIETSKVFRNVCEASRQTGIHRSAISNCLRGNSKSAGGYHWKYLNN